MIISKSVNSLKWYRKCVLSWLRFWSKNPWPLSVYILSTIMTTTKKLKNLIHSFLHLFNEYWCWQFRDKVSSTGNTRKIRCHASLQVGQSIHHLDPKKPMRQVSRTRNPCKMWAHLATQLYPSQFPKFFPLHTTLACLFLFHVLTEFKKQFLCARPWSCFFHCWNHALDWINLKQFISTEKKI